MLETVRSVVTDGQGARRVVELRPVQQAQDMRVMKAEGL